MLESIKTALGEELSKQVAEALKTANIELAVMNDGSVVKADKHDSLKAEYKTLADKYQTDISESNSKLENAIASAADYDTLKGTLESLQAENTKIAEDHQTELMNIKKMSAVDVALLEANIDKSYLNMAKSQLNMESLNFDGDNLIGLTDSIKAVQEKFPKLFGEVKKVGVTIDNGMNPQKTGKQQLIDKYNQAEKSGDTRSMMQLDKQIRAIKE